jgi:predicted nucleic acid-binding protein
MNKVFVDTDVILDLLLDRSPFNHDAVKLFTLMEQNRLRGFTSPVVIANLFYLLKKHRDRRFAATSLIRLKLLLRVSAVTEKIVDLALSSDFSDFEDAIQYFTARENAIPYLLTRNVKDYREKELIVCTPGEFLVAHKL